MKNSDVKNETSGNDVMKTVGSLDEATTRLKDDQAKDCDATPEEVGNWIAAIGKALLSIFGVAKVR